MVVSSMRALGTSPPLRRSLALLGALLLLAAALVATPHGHLAGGETKAGCATCVYAASSGLRTLQPTIAPPRLALVAAAPPLVESDGHPRPPLASAPKHGPPAA